MADTGAAVEQGYAAWKASTGQRSANPERNAARQRTDGSSKV
jgi:hypothetical protein